MARKRKFLPGDPRGEASNIVEEKISDIGYQRRAAKERRAERAQAAEEAAASRPRIRDRVRDAASYATDGRVKDSAKVASEQKAKVDDARTKRERWGFKEAPKIEKVRRGMPKEGYVSAQELAGVQGLERQILEAENAYMDSIAKSRMFTPQQESSDVSMLTSHHKKFVSMMMLASVQSLENGVTGANIMRTIGISMMMWKLSPEFRGAINKGKDELTDMVESYAADKASKGKRGWENWQMLAERMHKMRDGDRLPYTARSAAMAEIAMNDRSYSLMRLDGVDQQGIMDKRAAAVENLYKMADYDGISADEIAKESRKIVGERLLSDPSYAARYGELYNGEFAMAPDREFVIDNGSKTGRRIFGWDGEFEHVSGARVNGGTFGVRPKMDAEGHFGSIGSTIMNDLKNAPNTDEMHARMMTYALGWGGMPQGDVLSKMDRNTPGHRRLRNSMSMMQAMGDDGFSEQDAHYTYTNAFMAALQQIEMDSPETAAAWSARYGESWRETLQHMAENPDSVRDFWKRAEQRSRGESGTTAGNRGTYNTTDQRESQTYGRTQTSREQPGPGQSWSTSTPERGSGRAGADPVQRFRDAAPGVSEQARLAERVKRNQRYNAAGPSSPLGPDSATITGQGCDAPDNEVIEGRVMDDDEPSP